MRPLCVYQDALFPKLANKHQPQPHSVILSAFIFWRAWLLCWVSQLLMGILALLPMTREVKACSEYCCCDWCCLTLGSLLTRRQTFVTYAAAAGSGAAVWGCCCCCCCCRVCCLPLHYGVVELEITHKEETADRLGVQHNKNRCARFLLSNVYVSVCLRVCV